jgi:hypothetical protein
MEMGQKDVDAADVCAYQIVGVGDTGPSVEDEEVAIASLHRHR